MANDSIGIRKLLQSSETAATVIHAILVAKYGQEIYDWDLLTVIYEVQDDFGIEMPAAVTNKWAAMQTVMTTDVFFKRLDAFLAICNTFTVGEPYFTVFDPATVEEAAWGLAEVSLNREMLPFSSAIRGYLRQIAAGDYTGTTMPSIFSAVIDRDDDEAPEEIRAALKSAVTSDNMTVLQAYLDERMDDMAFQFNQVPSLGMTARNLINNPRDTIVDTL